MQKPRTYKYCPHCNKQLNLKTYKEHKRLHFDESSRMWYTVESDDSSEISSPEDDRSSSSSESSNMDYSEPHSPLDRFLAEPTMDEISDTCTAVQGK